MSLTPAERAALHADAIATVTAFEPGAAAAEHPEWARQQRQARERILDHLQAGPDAVWREGPRVHLTGSCVVISPDGAQVLLTLHRKAQLWLQFGGHAEPGDGTFAGTALREAREESGITDPAVLALVGGPVDLDCHTLSSRFGHCQEHLDVRYVAVADPDDPAAQHAVSEESEDVRWWPADALPEDCPVEELTRLISLARERVVGDHARP